MPSLGEVIVRVDRTLTAHGIDHGFGGALALAAAGAVRATADVDVNVFVQEADHERLLDALEASGAGLDRDSSLRRMIERADLQVKIGEVRLDVFLPFDPFHDAVRARLREAPLEGTPVRVISPEDLIVFKVLFDRPKDWVDLATLSRVRAGDLESTYLWFWVDRLLEQEDPRRGRLQSIVPRALGPESR